MGALARAMPPLAWAGVAIFSLCSPLAADGDFLLPPLGGEAKALWDRALGRTSVNTAPALLVSRHRFGLLPALRSWQDLTALRAYVEWADRPEEVGYRGGIVRAHTGPGDLILLRVPAARVKASVPVHRDPVGFAVLDPEHTGWVEIRVRLLDAATRIPDLPRDFPLQPVPVIAAAVEERPSLVVLYGEALDGRKVKAACRGGPAEILYKSAGQVNLRATACGAVSVEVDGVRSDWREVRK